MVTMYIQKIDTKLNADSVEFCPYEGLQHYLLCGTYKLDSESTCKNLATVTETEAAHDDDLQEAKNLAQNADINESSASEVIKTSQIRNGGVIVYKLNFDDVSDPSLEYCHNETLCGILDIKWPQLKIQDEAIFGLVDSQGFVQVMKLQENSTIQPMVKHELSESSLGLSLGWSNVCQSGCAMLTASDSTGFVSLFSLGQDFNKVSTWRAHEYEAWITAFDYFNPYVVYSGGDDATFKVWDTRDISRPKVCSKRHCMGVCSTQSHPFKEHIVATGSYDENIIIWDKRNFQKPLDSITLDGGVWRIKWDPFDGNHILTATMYNGAHIVDCKELGKDLLTKRVEYQDHNLAYGADWCRLNNLGLPWTDECKSNKNVSYLVSTCSFYDHSLHIWKWSLC